MKRVAPCLVIVIVSAVAWLGPGARAQTWAPASSASIHPGVQTFTDPSGQDSQCTANFVFTDGTNVYIGQAAHCASTGASTDTNGCTTTSLPLGTEVDILGADHHGTLVYSSWLAMQAANNGQGETDANACAYNDFALVKIDPADVSSVNPSIPHWGGPVAINAAGTQNGDTLYTYGNSVLRLGVTLLAPRTAASLGDDPATGGWTHPAITTNPDLPGDSGSPFLDKDGNALGDEVTIALTDVGLVPPGTVNNVSDLAHELAYLHSHGLPDVQLVLGTEAFDPNQLPLDTAQPVDDPVGSVCAFYVSC